MTKVRFKGPIGGFSGAMDGMVFADNGERTVAYIRKERKGEKSEAELERDENWAEARAYAISVKESNPDLWELYQQVGRERKVSPFALAVGDYLKPPSFRSLDLKNYKGQVGDPIQVHAVDNIGLASVEFSIERQDGSSVEKGMAFEMGARTGFWTFKATQPVALGTGVFIEVVGLDHAGHEVRMSESPVVGGG
jgi:hypothetical protein